MTVTVTKRRGYSFKHKHKFSIHSIVHYTLSVSTSESRASTTL